MSVPNTPDEWAELLRRFDDPAERRLRQRAATTRVRLLLAGVWFAALATVFLLLATGVLPRG